MPRHRTRGHTGSCSPVQPRRQRATDDHLDLSPAVHDVLVRGAQHRVPAEAERAADSQRMRAICRSAARCAIPTALIWANRSSSDFRGADIPASCRWHSFLRLSHLACGDNSTAPRPGEKTTIAAECRHSRRGCRHPVRRSRHSAEIVRPESGRAGTAAEPEERSSRSSGRGGRRATPGGGRARRRARSDPERGRRVSRPHRERI